MTVLKKYYLFFFLKRILLPSVVVVFGIISIAEADNALPELPAEQLQHFFDSRQQPTLVVVMASWCGPCVEELPRINDFSKKYLHRGVTVVGLSLDFNPAAMKRLLQKNPVNFPFYWVGEKGIDTLNAVNVPLFLLLRPGEKQQRLQGAMNDTQLESIFEALASN